MTTAPSRSDLAMGLHWMSKEGAREAVPPVFTEYIGRELLSICLTNDKHSNQGSEI